MSINAPTHFTQQYSTNVELLLQENGGKLRPYVTVGSHVGKAASPVNQIGAVSMKSVTSRFTSKTPTNAAYSRRWVYPSDFSLDQLLDDFDQLKMITDPKSAYAINAAKAAGRTMDDLVIEAALGNAKYGENGGSTESFDTSNYSIAADVGASGDVGLTVEKLIATQEKFQLANVDLEMEMPTLVISPKQHADLLRQTEVVSKDFNDRPALVDGIVRKFMGFNIVISNRLDVISTDQRTCFAFVASGLYLGIWNDIQSDAHQRFDLEANPWELTTTLSSGSTRLEQGKVIRVLCDEG